MASSVHHKKQDLNLILLGKTGDGKSSTGNLILGRLGFVASDGKNSCTSDPKLCSVVKKNGCIIRIVDTPGLCDTITKQKETVETIAKAVTNYKDGFDALVFVINYVGRFTAESTNTLRILKEMFGPKLLQHCIVVVTHGSSFDIANKDKSFTDWCATQGDPELDNLFKQCNNRAVLFYNEVKINKKTNKPLDPEDAEKQETCVEKLIEMVQQMPGRYTNYYFEKCAIARERIAIEQDLPILKVEIHNSLADLNAYFHKALSDLENGEKLDVSNLRNQSTELVKHIETSQGRTDALKKLRDDAVCIRDKIEKLSNANQDIHALINEMKKETELLQNPPSVIISVLKFSIGYLGSFMLGATSVVSGLGLAPGLAAASSTFALAMKNVSEDGKKHEQYIASRTRYDEKEAALAIVKSNLSKLHDNN